MKKLWLLNLMLALVFVLAACGTPAATQPPAAAPTEAVAVTEAPAMTEALATTEAPAATEAAPEQPKPGGENHLVLATTTSTQDSGLLDVILPLFEQETGATVDVIAVGTGQALEIGKNGDADVLLVHARAKEDEFMAAGDGVRREDVMYNDFIVVGPESDPAGIQGMTDAPGAFQKIAETQSPFISRGDESGTHTKEKSIWAAAKVEPAGDWYISSGQGMGEVLTMANEQQAYTLSDRATYLAQKDNLELVILVEGDKTLFNPYGVIAVDPGKNPNIQTDLANQFIDWIISVPTQEKIAEFGKAEFGQSLFIPSSKPYMDTQGGAATGEPAATEAAATGDVALKITGKVTAEKSWTEAEIKAMPTMEAESTNKAGEKVTYTGVLLSALLAEAAPAADATTIVFVADDGFTAEVPLADVMACTNCILSFREQGGFSIVMPGFSTKLQVKGVVEIQVK